MKPTTPAQDPEVSDPEVESQSTDYNPTAKDVGSTTGTLQRTKWMRRNLTRYAAAVLNISGAGAVTHPVPNLHVDVNKD